jgi:hypothetical protein
LPEYNNNFTKEKFKITTLYEKKSYSYWLLCWHFSKNKWNLFKNDNNNKIITIDGVYNNTNVIILKEF